MAALFLFEIILWSLEHTGRMSRITSLEQSYLYKSNVVFNPTRPFHFIEAELA
ncbi:hypothetical protein CHCC20335_4388 [Bacillus paralicheniformis]|nr:hypothetical protein CHCC20335_4388 [Bacillus paralicheniformis]